MNSILDSTCPGNIQFLVSVTNNTTATDNAIHEMMYVRNVFSLTVISLHILSVMFTTLLVSETLTTDDKSVSLLWTLTMVSNTFGSPSSIY